MGSGTACLVEIAVVIVAVAGVCDNGVRGELAFLLSLL